MGTNPEIKYVRWQALSTIEVDALKRQATYEQRETNNRYTLKEATCSQKATHIRLTTLSILQLIHCKLFT